MYGPQIQQFQDQVALSYAVTSVLTPGAITANTTYSTTITVPGAAVGDEITAVCNQALGNVVMAGEVNAANTVTLKIQNCTAGAITPPGGANYTVIGWRYNPKMFT